MKTIRFNRWQILLPIAAWWAAFIALSAFNYNRFQLLNIVGFLFLAVVPGLLTMLLSKIRGLPFWGYAGLTVGFSILELILMALLGNTFLPFAGIAHPLEKPTLLLELYPLIAVLMAFVWLRVKELEISVREWGLFDNLRDYVLSFTPIIFVVLSVFGAIRLNDGGSNILTMIMLGGIGAYFAILFYYAKTLDENTIPTALFFISLSLLLMTDLRGWYVTGHDIQAEYKVFELAKSAGIWNVAVYQDAYNACLSITILPTLLANLLSIPDPYVFKVFFQFFFAIVPSIVYLIARRWTSLRISLLSVIYFIGFTTFFQDMPFLNRQEIAFLFFGLMLYVIFEPKLSLKVRRGLFLIMGVGIILSHYSTTYTVLAVLGLAIVVRPIFVGILKRLRENKLFRHSALIPSKDSDFEKPNITIPMVIALFALSFLWTSIITKTGDGLTSVIDQTFTAIQNGFGGDNRSIDATSLLTLTKPDQNQELQDYITHVADPVRVISPTDYFSPQAYDQYPLVALSDETIPITPLGTLVEHLGIKTSAFLFFLNELIGKLIEVLVPVGMLYVLFRKSVVKYMDSELYLIACCCLAFIFLNIILPVLSVEYGIYRAIQQSLFVVAPIIVIASIGLGKRSREAWQFIMRPFRDPESRRVPHPPTGETFAAGFAIIFFLYTTFFIPYLLGTGPATLHLSNNGTYYDDYLLQDVEVSGVSWLTSIAGTETEDANGVRLVVQTSRYNKFQSLTALNAYSDILPAVVRKASYVFLAPITVEKDRATEIYNADQINYQYPIPFLQDNKDLIYNNGGAEVYR